MYVENFFELNCEDKIREMTPVFGYGGFGEAVYYLQYSRVKDDGEQEHWADTVLRVINGVFSIRKDWYMKNSIHWDEMYWQGYAYKMAVAMFRMEWLPPGRGVWAMGTNMVYERGAMPLYNCAFSEIHAASWSDDLCWIMDSLMNGVGVGFAPIRDKLVLEEPIGTVEYQVPDSREGWVQSVRLLLKSFEGGYLPIFDYSLVRPEGTPIKTFGGTASGPKPLYELHEKVADLCYRYIHEEGYDVVTLKTDISNLIGKCVVAGNVRRSAEIAIAPITDEAFMDLKNYTLHPERKAHGWMSNNTVTLKEDSDFELIGAVAERVRNNGEPGLSNLRNVPKGRIGDTKYNLKLDKATGWNPCAEIPLEHREVCNLSETLPTRCADVKTWLKACEYATFYCSTVSLLPTHQVTTNSVVVRNRRIGVSIIDFIGWKASHGLHNIINFLRQGYNTVRNINAQLADEAGVPHSLRVTAVKPGGTIPKIAGRRSGMMHSNFIYQIRRIRVSKAHPAFSILHSAKVPYEDDADQPDYTSVFEFPVCTGTDERAADEVSLWEQLMNLIVLQREWADNAVSNTLNFRTEKDYPESHEEFIIPFVLAAAMPHIKSLSLLPHTVKGVYKQMPEEGITQLEYANRVSAIKEIDWSQYKGSDGVDERFCDGDNCEIKKG